MITEEVRNKTTATRELPAPPREETPSTDRRERTYLPKALLQIDHSYQRVAGPDKIRRMTRDWDWKKCSELLVSQRNNGEYFVYDGGHRLGAALGRPEIDKLPCVISRGMSIDDEARAYLSANEERKNVTEKEKFRARVIGGDPVAIMVNRVTGMTGHGLDEKGVMKLNPVKSLQEMAKKNPSMFERLWPLVTEVCLGRFVEGWFTEAVFSLEEALEREGADHSICDDERWYRKMLKEGYAEIVKWMEEEVAARPSMKNIRIKRAEGLRKLLNRNMRSNKLPPVILEAN